MEGKGCDSAPEVKDRYHRLPYPAIIVVPLLAARKATVPWPKGAFVEAGSTESVARAGHLFKDTSGYWSLSHG